MKKLYTIICSLLLMSCTMFPKNEDKSTEIVGKIIQKTASTLSKKYNMQPIGTGISMPAGKEQGYDCLIGLEIACKNLYVSDTIYIYE